MKGSNSGQKRGRFSVFLQNNFRCPGPPIIVCWELEEPKGPQGPGNSYVAYRVSHHRSLGYRERRCGFDTKHQSTKEILYILRGGCGLAPYVSFDLPRWHVVCSVCELINLPFPPLRKGEVLAYVGLVQNLKDLKDSHVTSPASGPSFNPTSNTLLKTHLRGASLGTKTELGHRLIIVLEMAWDRQ